MANTSNSSGMLRIESVVPFHRYDNCQRCLRDIGLRFRLSPFRATAKIHYSLRTSVSKSLRHQRIAKATTIAILRSYYLFGSPGLTDTLERGQIAKEVAKVMTVLLIEPILDRYVAQAERREEDWSPKEVEALLLKLRKEILDCLK